MPYIKKERRDEIVDATDIFGDGEIFHNIVAEHIETPGELNYAISKLVDNYLNRKGLNYANANEVIGVLECAKLELYRRILAPFEDEKMIENGDVYRVIKD